MNVLLKYSFLQSPGISHHHCISDYYFINYGGVFSSKLVQTLQCNGLLLM